MRTPNDVWFKAQHTQWNGESSLRTYGRVHSYGNHTTRYEQNL
jgi:hypothetical protein